MASSQFSMLYLVETLNKYRNSYYNANKSLVSDAEYDKMFDELKKMEWNMNIVFSNSPTREVGYDVLSKLTKVIHTSPLKSLDKTKSYDDLVKFAGDKETILMIKMDGLTIRLVYEYGILVDAVTRGNSEVGERVMHSVLKFKNVPSTIGYKGRLVVDGEAIIHREDFDKMNETLSDEEKHSTQRNLASGSVRQLDNRVCEARSLYFYAFAISEREEDIPDSKYEQFRFLTNNGFWPVYHMHQQNGISPIEHLESMRKSADDAGIPTDGMVLAFDSCSYGDSLGSSSHHFHNAIAYKFKDESVETVLRDIEWSVGRTGQITPVAIFDTVEIDGTAVSRASVHNLSIMRDLELGIGDKITVIKANMIIPQIEENLTRSDYVNVPVHCPVCNHHTFQETLNQSAVLYCVNKNCPAQIVGKLSHFVSRNAMNIDGLSESTITKLVEIGVLLDFADIYSRISQNRYSIIELEGFGIRSFNKLVDAIEKSRTVKMENFLFALGIDGVGQGTAKRIAKASNNDMYVFLENVRSFKGVSWLSKIPDIGFSTANSIDEFFNTEKNNEVIQELLMHLKFVKPEVIEVDTNNPFAGKIVIATGTLQNYTRKTINTKLVSLGAVVAESVSRKTDYVIVGSDAGGAKIGKAKEFGIRMITEEDFEEMLEPI